jgi:hypothetical protein
VLIRGPTGTKAITGLMKEFYHSRNRRRTRRIPLLFPNYFNRKRFLEGHMTLESCSMGVVTPPIGI